MPHFSNELLVSQRAHVEKLTFSYYLRHGRPSFAFVAFVGERLKDATVSKAKWVSHLERSATDMRGLLPGTRCLHVNSPSIQLVTRTKMWLLWLVSQGLVMGTSCVSPHVYCYCNQSRWPNEKVGLSQWPVPSCKHYKQLIPVTSCWATPFVCVWTFQKSVL